ncbi:uncharacterized protein LAESUDRAFT_732576 [Laetiporus sulphureus 93-53]|uniref:Uncharacterized protein n=1 Tax=Laetiporus sulphureus 93-53 TaxID=1314785 RepID=A0A165B2Y0_9APHY|nr:uncharacterized protein LAESUDRAFT_732576 [Laetiporus sulphureus 93-53]KZT00119.1 hypothetical protein LAESUDRAFT_732576 [Laetiporus sulphureus 93-53]
MPSAITNPDDHLRKVSRILAHFSEKYGHRPAGYLANIPKEGEPALDGAELLDGTL